MPKERGILFSAPMVRALLAGTKTQTRRALKPAPVGDDRFADGWKLIGRGGRETSVSSPLIADLCPYGQPGDRLWVRESFSGPHHQERHPPRDWHSTDPIHCWADGNPDSGDWTKPRPGMFMPRWASRITLEITEVRVERLNECTDADAMAEGIQQIAGRFTFNGGLHESRTPVESYRALWESINGPGSWDANPFVWAVSFKRVTR